jgi:hypothetical protein
MRIGGPTHHWYAYVAVAAASSLVTIALTRGAPVAAESSTDARLQRLEDESAIRHLMIEYGHDLDTRDYVAYSKLFAREGVWSGGIGTGRGPSGVLAMLQRTVGGNGNTPFDPNAVRSYHLDTNIMIDFIDRDHAKVFSRWTVMAKSQDNKLMPSLAGRYDDIVVREARPPRPAARELASTRKSRPNVESIIAGWERDHAPSTLLVALLDNPASGGQS